MVMREGGTVDLILPVGVLLTQGFHGSVVAVITLVQIAHELAELVTIHDVDRLLLHAHSHVTIIGNTGALTATAFLGGDDDDTIATTATIDSGGRSVLQHVEALDVLGVDQ